MTDFFALLRHDLRLHTRQASAWMALVMFLIIVVLLMPFALGPEADLLQRLAPGIIWLAALLMSLLALDKLFIADARDGTLDLMLLSPVPLPLIIAAKMAAHSLMMLAALGVVILPAALLLSMNRSTLPILLATFALGVPSLALLGGVAGAVTVALHRSPTLLTLLLVPFYIPILIFAVAACDAVSLGASPASALLFMGAILALLLPTAPWIIAAALRGACR